MPEYARILDGEVVEFRELSALPATLARSKGRWIVVESDPAPSYDAGSQRLAVTVTIDADRVVRGFTAEPLTLDEQRALKKAAAEAQFGARFAGGFTPAVGPLAGKTLQVRNVEDRTNWLASQAAYGAAVAAGAGTVEGATFRTASNENLTISYADGLSALLEMAAWGKAGYVTLWSLKDAIVAASDEAALQSIDVSAGW